MHYALIKDLLRSSKRDFCFSTFAMHRHYRWTFTALVMFMMIKAAPAVSEPFAKRRAFHQSSPISADASLLNVTGRKEFSPAFEHLHASRHWRWSGHVCAKKNGPAC
jgi:hypothetical protein